jgi:hypothetical protein
LHLQGGPGGAAQGKTDRWTDTEEYNMFGQREGCGALVSGIEMVHEAWELFRPLIMILMILDDIVQSS